jgi:electron transport complex protein RnfC
VNGKTFPGGVHPPEYKELTRDKAIENFPSPSKVVIPLSQHIGAPCEPKVEVGESVRKGQKIGDSEAFVSSPVHASISGKVKSIEPHLSFLGTKIPSIVIEREEEGDGEEICLEVPEDPTPDDVKKIVREAGIVGLGGAAFPTHVKLSPPPDKPIDAVIINGCECEPFLNNDFRLMVEKPDSIVDGLKLIMMTLSAKRGFIGIETNKPEAIKILSEKVKGESDIEVVPLETKYPQGSEKHLIKAILGREVPSGGLPFEVGAYVQNVQTTVAISEAVRKGKVLTERVMTVSGPGVKNPLNLRVSIGTLASEIIDYCGGLTDDVGKVVFGGPMTGFAQSTLEIPVVKGTSGLTCLTREMVIPTNHPLYCIRCGKCVQVCPVNLVPNTIASYGYLGMFEDAEEYGALDCIECGSCGYVCPSRRPLVQLIKFTKAKILEKKKKKK